MEFTFKIQQYQTDAVESVTRVFRGQGPSSSMAYLRDLGRKKKAQAPFGKIDEGKQLAVSETGNYTDDGDDAEDMTGFRNGEIVLSNAELLQNIRAVQSENNIHQSESLTEPLGRCSLDIEMETGTGKTYVYIKTMFELNRLYGWSKFIVVVPSLAIREGVKKSFDMMKNHFFYQYHQHAAVFVYDSGNLTELDNFSKNAGIQVMIINTQAFAASLNESKNVAGSRGNKAARIIYSEQEKFGYRRPINVIAANRPILILDEPQKMGKEGSATQKALRRFNPLFTLNYSATHAVKHNTVYVLDALDAFNQRLVKRIEVKGIEARNLEGANRFLYLSEIRVSPKEKPKAVFEMEVQRKKSIVREKKILREQDDLYYESENLEEYRNHVIAEINPIRGTVTFTNGLTMKIGEVIGDVAEQDERRIQIRETILAHFEKEEKLFKQGIKTLSLFFIDEVAKYRQYDADGNELLGEYGKIFEEEYLDILNERRSFLNPDYLAYLDSVDVSRVHQGYFSIDKKGRSVNSSTKRGTDLSDDISAYDLILRKKERLLDFEEPTRFIFSHSALREGWDNPNVFQICTLKHSDSNVQRRQEVGRGLRLCVNQQGIRMDAQVLGENGVHELNVLTVISNEKYSAFVAGLQDELKRALYNRPTQADVKYFTGKTVKLDGKPVYLTEKQADRIHRYLIKNDYVDDEDHITQEYRTAAECRTLVPLPDELKGMEDGIHRLIQAIYDDSVLKDMVEDGNRTKVTDNPLNSRFYRKEFQTLWNEINHRYAYTVEFDSQELIAKAIAHIDQELRVSRLQYTVTVGEQKEQLDAEQLQDGEGFEKTRTCTTQLRRARGSQVPYDLLGKIAEGTVLTRRTAAAILKGIRPDTFAMYRENPEEFITGVIRLIKEQKAAMVAEHITYNRIEGSYDSNIFTIGKHSVPVEDVYPAKKAIQDYVYTDGTAGAKSVERRFAEELDYADEVMIYAKLPRGFSIPTPVGNYSPDWAIVFNEGKVKHIYFVAETKGSLESAQLRPIERAKINCAEKLFTTLSNGRVNYHTVTNYQDLYNIVTK